MFAFGGGPFNFGHGLGSRGSGGWRENSRLDDDSMFVVSNIFETSEDLEGLAATIKENGATSLVLVDGCASLKALAELRALPRMVSISIENFSFGEEDEDGILSEEVQDVRNWMLTSGNFKEVQLDPMRRQIQVKRTKTHFLISSISFE
jgi:hypothetical protein